MTREELDRIEAHPGEVWRGLVEDHGEETPACIVREGDDYRPLFFYVRWHTPADKYGHRIMAAWALALLAELRRLQAPPEGLEEAGDLALRSLGYAPSADRDEDSRRVGYMMIALVRRDAQWRRILAAAEEARAKAERERDEALAEIDETRGLLGAMAEDLAGRMVAIAEADAERISQAAQKLHASAEKALAEVARLRRELAAALLGESNIRPGYCADRVRALLEGVP